MKNKNNKEKLRKKMIKKRKNTFQNNGLEKSKKIKRKILSLNEIQEAENIMIYVSYRSEVNTDDLIISLLHNNKNVFAPYCIKEEKKMEIVKINDPNKDLKKDSYGIKEPVKSLRNNKKDPKILDAVIVPAVAFSKKGYRIGYGGGYYDRFLPRLNDQAISIGINYNEMIFNSVPTEDHDLAVDLLVTDQEIFKIAKN